MTPREPEGVDLEKEAKEILYDELQCTCSDGMLLETARATKAIKKLAQRYAADQVRKALDKAAQMVHEEYALDAAPADGTEKVWHFYGMKIKKQILAYKDNPNDREPWI